VEEGEVSEKGDEGGEERRRDLNDSEPRRWGAKEFAEIPLEERLQNTLRCFPVSENTLENLSEEQLHLLTLTRLRKILER